MVRKRHPPLVDLSSSDDDNDDDDSTGSDSETETLNKAVYENCLKEYHKLLQREKKLSRALLHHSSKKPKYEKNTKDAFTRFSVSTFSSVIAALTLDNRRVIEKYGFKSLLEFDKCIVPNKFAKWVARAVDYKSGDIILDGKVISLSKQSVHDILHLPIGGSPFPSDYSAGKSKVLSCFGKQSLPQVSFFAQKLLNHEAMSDEDVFICFMLVAMNSFLCPNSSLKPSSRYLGVFENIENAKNFDWSGFILQWLLDHIKLFNCRKGAKGMESQTLGGCIFYLAVLYLDHVDFGVRQVPVGIPRISVWRQNMITTYSELDKKSLGIYGLRPLLQHSSTCYSKNSNFMQNNNSTSLSTDSAFLESLDVISGCKLPSSFKLGICKLIDDHCFDSRLSIQMDLTAISSLPDDMKLIFSQLLNHVSSIDSRAKKLVLSILKIICDPSTNNDDANGSGHDLNAPSHATPLANMTPAHDLNAPSHATPLANLTPDTAQNSAQHEDCGDACQHLVHSEIKETHLKSCNPISHKSYHDEEREVSVDNKKLNSGSLPVDTSDKNTSDFSDKLQKNSNEKAKQKMQSSDVVPSSPSKRQTPKRFEIPPSGYPKQFFPQALSRSSGPRIISESNILSARNPLRDISNRISLSRPQKSVPFAQDKDISKDIIYLENHTDFVPDSTSPDRPTDLSSFYSQRCSAESDDDGSPLLTQKMMSPDVQIIGERSLVDNVREMTRKSEIAYNSTFINAEGCSQTPSINASKLKSSTPMSLVCPEISGRSAEYKLKNSSSGGKVPCYGPRRIVHPSRNLGDEFIIQKPSFKVTKSDVQNYNAICQLASSKWSNEDAINLGGVRCTFWSFGESMREGGIVLPYVVSAFCYHLFLSPFGHPDDSKKHYFFPSIGENLMKHPDDANDAILTRAFKLSTRTRPLHKSDMLFFPTLFDDHWFIFVIDIKDKKFVFLDPFYNKDDNYQQFVRERMIPSFKVAWDKFMNVEMKFDEYDVIYPTVPRHSADNMSDAGIIAMMCLQYWKSPRSVLSTVFKACDVPNIRIKIANTLMFLPRNQGKKILVTEYYQ